MKIKFLRGLLSSSGVINSTVKHGEIVCFNRTRGWLVAKPHIRKWWSCDMRIANWYENMKLIWKYETGMNIKRPRRNHSSERWEYETDMKIWNWYENIKYETDMKIWNCSVWYSHVSVYCSYVDDWCIHIRAAGMKIHLAGIKTRSQRKNGLPSSYVDVCNFQYGDSGNENLFRRKNVRWMFNVDKKNQREQSRKTFHNSYVNTYSYVNSLIHILTMIPLLSLPCEQVENKRSLTTDTDAKLRAWIYKYNQNNG